MDNQLASLNPAFGIKKPSFSAKPKPVVFNVNSRDDAAAAAAAAKQCPLCLESSHFSLDKCKKFHALSIAQRRTAAKSCKVCYICLNSDHARKSCKSKKTCSICGKNHHDLVHTDAVPRNITPRTPNVCNVNGRNANTLLRVGKVKIMGPNGVEEVFALFDEGSSLSMVDANVAARIGLQGPTSPVTYRWTNGISHKEEHSMLLSFDISGPSTQAKRFRANGIRTVQNLDLPPVKFDIEKVKQLYPMLDEDKLVAVHGARPCMLIGSNNAGLIVPLKTVQYSLYGLQLTRCHLGWTVHGSIEPSDAAPDYCHALLCSEDDDVELTDLVKQVYKVEDFGITGQSPKISDEDQRAIDIMNRTITRRGERFEVGQLYKYNNFSFPDSKPHALRRLQIIERKMDSNPEFAEKYCSKIEDYVNKGYARLLEPGELDETPNTWPLTHVSDDPLDAEPLTPNMLLLGRNNSIQFDHDFDERNMDCRAAYKSAQIYADRFWRKWLSSYRPELIRSRKWPDNRSYHEYHVGDVVMIVDENLHRGCWPKGIVDKVFKGPDGNVRTVSVKTSKSSFTRPVSKIVLLQAISSSLGPENVANSSCN
nr:uncharacterized protein LOC115265178 [Aedes albopictus]